MSKNDGNVLMAKKKSFKKYKSKQRKCYNCGSTFHLSKTCDKPKKPSNEKSKKNGYAKNAFCALMSKADSCEWYIDSGASNHMTPFKNLLKNTKSTSVNDIISANNSKMRVSTVGDTTIKLH